MRAYVLPGCLDATLSACVEVPATRRAHLVGIGGAGMRSLAEVLLGWGWDLSGSDSCPGSAQFLGAEGVPVYSHHAEAHVPTGVELIVYSDAVTAGNPERRRGADLAIPTLSYFQMLGRLMRSRRGIAVAGTHGKSTVAAMLAGLLVRAQLDPTVVFGAAPLGRDSGGRSGGGELMLVEACEYRANFLHLRPEQAVILGIEPDHFDCFPTTEALESAFCRFAANLPDTGRLLIPQHCRASRRAAAGARCRVETFGLGAQADWSARHLRDVGGGFQFSIYRGGRPWCDVRLAVPGRHNVLNALAAVAMAGQNGLEPAEIAAGLTEFRGLHRRLESLGCYRGVNLVDDYAHHPTEVAAGLETVRRMYPGRRLWCVFQPHQASRTQRLLDELASSLQNADRLVVAEIYRAREHAPRPGEVTAADLAARARAGGVLVEDVHATDQILGRLCGGLAPNDVLITMGAGDIRKICHGFIDRVREDRAA